jgi:hypothetical protein
MTMVDPAGGCASDFPDCEEPLAAAFVAFEMKQQVQKYTAAKKVGRQRGDFMAGVLSEPCEKSCT